MLQLVIHLQLGFTRGAHCYVALLQMLFVLTHRSTTDEYMTF